MLDVSLLLLLLFLLLGAMLCTFLGLCLNVCPERDNQVLERVEDTRDVHLGVKVETVLMK